MSVTANDAAGHDAAIATNVNDENRRKATVVAQGLTNEIPPQEMGPDSNVVIITMDEPQKIPKVAEPQIQTISDPAELRENQQRMRHAYEDIINIDPTNVYNRIAHAEWKNNQKDIERARSIYEDDNEPTDTTLWIKYAELETRHGQLKYAREPQIQTISDPVELRDYQQRIRHAYEDIINIDPTNVYNWIAYAEWENNQKDIERARSIYEDVLDNKPTNITLWIKYAELEMRHGQLKYVREVWNRAVFNMCHVYTLWYRYIYMEEMLGNVAEARAIFERWIRCRPREKNYKTYIKFELRYQEVERARKIYNNLVRVHPNATNWIRYAKFEEQNGFIEGARDVFKKAVVSITTNVNLFVAFAKFEERQNEDKRASGIYNRALNLFRLYNRFDVYKANTIQEKIVNDRVKIILQFEEVKGDPTNYDAWLEYLKLVQSEGKVDVIRDTYKQAVANKPSSNKKSAWRQYVYLWINYALFEEIQTGDEKCTRDVYQTFLATIPHKLFTFSKAWLYYAQFEIRHGNITAARNQMDIALESCPTDKLFRRYIDLERRLKEFDRCRILYEKHLEFKSENDVTWIKFAELETVLGRKDRARAIYELAVNQQRLDNKFKVWMNYIHFEANSKEKDVDNISLVRKLFERGNKAIQRDGTQTEKQEILESWYTFEEENKDKDRKFKEDEEDHA